MKLKLQFTIVRSVLFTVVALVSLSATATMSGQALTAKEELGKALFFDKISSPDSMSCAECHAPSVGFTGAVPGINKRGAVYSGAVPHRFGNRKPPSAAYATFSPVFHFNEEAGLFIGGTFWDGRATGERLGNPAADQALGPFLNPVEQNNPDEQAVLEQIAKSKYAPLWEAVWSEPIDWTTPEDVAMNYDRVGLAIAAYEASPEVNAFSSKYDAYLAGLTELTDREAWGLELFEGKAMCSLCHPNEPGPDGTPPLFTDFTYDNLGLPKNPDNPFYRMDEVFLDDGSPINPEGADWIDPGLAGFLITRPDYADKALESLGKHKVPTLRNVAKRPGNGFTKAFGHNGYFKSLKAIVHFYNTRDVKPVCPDPATEREALAMDCWPAPEVPWNVNDDELGDLELTDDEEDALVAFMETLSDGWTPKGNGKKGK